VKKLTVVAVNIALCLLLVEGFSAVALKRVEGRWWTPGRFAESVRDESANASPTREGSEEESSEPEAEVEKPGEDEALGARLDAPRWMIQPYFGYARNPEIEVRRFNGLKIRSSINEHGLFGPTPVPEISSERFIVALTGGSVALELYLHSREPLLQELKHLPGARGKEVEVVCLALGGMKQPQQLLQLNYFLSLGAEYDLVINLDGFNEVALPLVENLARGVNPFFPRNWVAYSATSVDLETATVYGRLADLGRSKDERAKRFLQGPLRWTFTGCLVHALRQRRIDGELQANEMRLRELMSEETLAPQQRGPTFPYAKRDRAIPELVAVWQNSSIQMSALSRGLGIPYFHFLQPNQYVAGSKPFSAWELEYAINTQADYARNAIPGYPLLHEAGRTLTQEGVAFFDLTGIYSEISEPIYRDNCCHVNTEGGAIMARAIGERIVAATNDLSR